MTNKTTFNINNLVHSSKSWLVDRTILLTLHGSQVYGTSTPASDYDFKGICIPPLETFLAPNNSFEQHTQNDPDLVVFGLQKFISLASTCNPNIIETLFTSQDNWVKATEQSEKLWMHRYDFLSKKVRYSFGGYAKQQLNRIKTHRSWLLNPPTEAPNREKFGLSKNHKMSATEYGAMEALEAEGYDFPSSMVEFVQKEKAYRSAMKHWEQYHQWKNTRNKDRAEMEAKYHYDVKHGMHLVRLLRMCEEILREGEVHVKRPDAEELLSIRSGEWTYDQLIEWSDEQEKKIDLAFKNSHLPNDIDKKLINDLCVSLSLSTFTTFNH